MEFPNTLNIELFFRTILPQTLRWTQQDLFGFYGLGVLNKTMQKEHIYLH